jgi:hypothetical protein
MSSLTRPAADLATTALRYAQVGWPVFPCKPGAKIPVIPGAHPLGDPARAACRGECGRQGHGFYDATTDPAVIRAWWDRWPEANVAIATGAPGPDVLDVDVKPDGDGWAAFNRLRRAGLLGGGHALVRTPSGGLHVYYAGTSQACGRLPHHHLDFKAAGGYVLAPPSMVGGKPYQLLDHRMDRAPRIDWAAARYLLDPPRLQWRRSPGGEADIRGLVEWVARREPHDRNHSLYWAASQAAAAGLLDADAVEQFVDAALRAGLRGGEPEARRTIVSAARKAAK